MRTSGVVLRGSGNATIVAAGTGRRTSIEIGNGADAVAGPPAGVTDEIVRAGGLTLTLESADGLRPGDRIAIALITPEGLPLACEVMEGNTSDRTTLRGFLEKVEKIHGKARRVWLMDRGIPTEEVLGAGDPEAQAGALVTEAARHAAELSGVRLVTAAHRRGQERGRPSVWLRADFVAQGRRGRHSPQFHFRRGSGQATESRTEGRSLPAALESSG